MPPPPTPLSEMVDENTGAVRPPKLPVPMLMAGQRNARNRKMAPLPEDVVILPSGMAVRFKEVIIYSLLTKAHLKIQNNPSAQIVGFVLC